MKDILTLIMAVIMVIELARIRDAPTTAAVLCLLAAPSAAQAQDYAYATNKGTITLTQYNGPAGWGHTSGERPTALSKPQL